jgi:hypothetical protein
MTNEQKATIAKLNKYTDIIENGGIRTKEANDCLKSIKDPAQQITLDELEIREVPGSILDRYDY